jgi:small subunit ribosomal protein S20
LRFPSIQVKLPLASRRNRVCNFLIAAIGIVNRRKFTLANTASAQKEIRKTARRRQRNRLVKAKTRTVTKKATQAIAAGDKDAGALVREAQIELDAAAQKGIIHKNAAARKKSRLARRLNAAQAKK